MCDGVIDGANIRTLDELVWRFRVLRGWTVRMVNDPDNHGVSWGGRRSNHFSIGTWDKKDGPQPPDYILHEVLHAAVISVVRMDKRKPKEQRQAEEMLVQDLCRIIMPPEEIRTVQDLVRAITPAFGTGLWREREERVLRLRLVEGLTLRECAEQFGVTRERIRQIEEKALRKWRQKGGGR